LKTAIVTGSNTGIGRATATELARRGMRVILACRDLDRAAAVADGIRRDTRSPEVEAMHLDLASLASVARFADRFLSLDLPLDVLVNNAGVAGQRGVTRDGFEIHFGVNHLGHFKLTALLVPALERAAPARVVNVASKAHYDARSLELDDVMGTTRTFTGLREYERSKLANVLFTRSLAKRLDPRRVAVHALHPGVVASDAWRRIPWPVRWWMTRDMLSNEDGAKTSIYCATAEALAGESGLYYDACSVKAPSALAQDDALAERLFTFSEERTC